MSTLDKPRTPVPTDPPRHAGESLEEVIHDEHLGWWAFLCGCAWMTSGAAFIAWADHWLGTGKARWILTAMALFQLVWVGISFKKIREAVRRLRLGAKGERTVAAILAELKDYRAVHDLPIGPRPKSEKDHWPNVDHVLIGPAGIFAIETKTRTKPPATRGRATIHYDGERIRVGDGPQDEAPVKQARAAADYVRDVIRERTGVSVKVRPVLLYPGWWVTGPDDAPVRVDNPRHFLSWVRRQEHAAAARGGTLGPQDAQRFAAVLRDASKRD